MPKTFVSSPLPAVESTRSRRVAVLVDPAGEKVTFSEIVDTVIYDPLTKVTLVSSVITSQVVVEYAGLPVQWLLAPSYTNFVL